MTVAWLVVTILLSLCAMQFLSSGGFVHTTIGIMLFLLVIFCAKATRTSWRGFRPTVFDVDGDAIDGTTSRSSKN